MPIDGMRNSPDDFAIYIGGGCNVSFAHTGSMDRKERPVLHDGYTMFLMEIHCVTIAEPSINLFMVTRLHGYTMDFL